MNVFLTIGLFLLCMSGMAQCLDDPDHDFEYQLKEISIEGNTNVNNFAFHYEDQRNKRIIGENEGCYREPDSCILDFSIPVHSFRGNIPAMRSDFLKLLKASQYPVIVVGIEKSAFDCIATGSYEDHLDMIITLAGTKKAINADYSVHADTNNRIIISGQTKFRLTDFRLDPPEKVLGLIRVKNELFIKFDIVISNTSPNLNQALN